MNIKNNIIKALLFGSMLFTSIDVSAQYLATNNYYNSLLDDEPAVKFRRGAPRYVHANKQMHFSPKTTVGEALSYPAFEGFSHLLLHPLWLGQNMRRPTPYAFQAYPSNRTFV